MILKLVHIQNLNLFLKKILNKDPYDFYKKYKNEIEVAQYLHELDEILDNLKNI